MEKKIEERFQEQKFGGSLLIQENVKVELLQNKVLCIQ